MFLVLSRTHFSSCARRRLSSTSLEIFVTTFFRPSGASYSGTVPITLNVHCVCGVCTMSSPTMSLPYDVGAYDTTNSAPPSSGSAGPAVTTSDLIVVRPRSRAAAETPRALLARINPHSGDTVSSFEPPGLKYAVKLHGSGSGFASVNVVSLTSPTYALTCSTPSISGSVARTCTGNRHRPPDAFSMTSSHVQKSIAFTGRKTTAKCSGSVSDVIADLIGCRVSARSRCSRAMSFGATMACVYLSLLPLSFSPGKRKDMDVSRRLRALPSMWYSVPSGAPSGLPTIGNRHARSEPSLETTSVAS
mmetsp:Transcript_5184/g.18599  ORF Transcript_5184/g.18599 Transcript_5184/m.18599 type:complete len:304 (-) Transcript_5184:4047-4958(-)